MGLKRTCLYTKVSKKPLIFLRITGLAPEQFNSLILRINPSWDKNQAKKTKTGRPYQLGSLENQLLSLLMYYRVYTTQEFIGWLFGSDKATICRTIQRLAPLLVNVVSIKKAPQLSQEELETLLIDATEQTIERPKSNQKTYYSGKKKRHTLKTEIITNLQGRIVAVSKTYPGRYHDLSIRRGGKELPPSSMVLADSAYQGLQREHENLIIPFKKSKKKPLTAGQKEYNSKLSRVRVRVENKFREMKIFRILSHTYRNKRVKYGLIINIIAGLVNFKNGYIS